MDDVPKQNNDTSISKAADEETIQETITTKKEPEKTDEEILYATSSREGAELAIKEQEEENGEKKVEEKDEEDQVEQDYLPVSRFLMDKILQQEDTKNLGEEKAIECTDKQMISDEGIQIEEESNLVVVPEKKVETPTSFAETARDLEKGEALIRKVDNTFVGDSGVSREEKNEENSAVEELPKQEVSHSPIEVSRDFEKEEKPTEVAPKSIEDKKETPVSNVGISSVEHNEGENRSVVVVAEQGGTSPDEAVRDFEKEARSTEKNNEGLVTNDEISIIENCEEGADEVAVPKQGERTLYHVEVVNDFDNDMKPAEEKDETLVTVVGVCTPERTEEENSNVALLEKEVEIEPSVEEAEDLAYRVHRKDLIEEALVNAHETANPEKVIEKNKIVVMHKEEENKNEVIIDEETPKDVKNVEENYVFVEHEANQIEESKEMLKEKVSDEVSNPNISNLEEKQTNLSSDIHTDRSLVGQVEITERGLKNSSVICQKIEQSLPDIFKVPMVNEIVKEPVDNESDFIHGDEQVKEVTGTVVERIEKKSQETLAEIEAAKMEKKSEEIKDEEHEGEGEEEEEEEVESNQEREAEIIGRDLSAKAEAREMKIKPVQKKSHNILSGVGSKVKHSLTKVKKALIGKSKNSSPSAK
jgi:golgin subfamily B member 1